MAESLGDFPYKMHIGVSGEMWLVSARPGKLVSPRGVLLAYNCGGGSIKALAGGGGQSLNAEYADAHDQADHDGVFDRGRAVFVGQEPLRLKPNL